MGRYTHKRGPGVAADSKVALASNGDFAMAHPATWEHLTLAVEEDGSRRETMSILVVCDEGRLKAWLNDRENSVSAWVTADGWEGLWEAVEAALESGEADWRAAKRSTSGKNRR